MFLRIEDVANRAGVSKATVSRVLNGRFEEMSEETRARVERVIQELQYSPNALARGLKVKRTCLLGIVVTDLSNRFVIGVIEGAEKVCRSRGYNLLIANTAGSGKTELEVLEVLRSRQVDGLIVNPTGSNNEAFAQFIKQRHPIVFLDRKGDGPADLVTVDNFRGAYAAVDHLVAMGHRRIGIILLSPVEISPRSERLAGYKAVLEHNGIPLDPDLITVVPYERGAARNGTERLLSLKDPPTAIFSTNGVIHLEVLSAIRSRELQVPKDVSVIGFDDADWTELIDSPLTVVAQPLNELGATAANLLLNRLSVPSAWKPTVTLLEPKLIVRKSCGAPARLA